MYQIKDWDLRYENAGSRKVEHCAWCPIPNKQDGLGYALLIQGKTGSARYAAFVATVLVCSKHPLPRNGWLTADGTETGRPLTAYDLHLKTKLPENEIKEMLERASKPDIGWITEYSPSVDSTLVAGYRPASNMTEGNRREQKGTEQKEEEPLTGYEQKIETYFSSKIDNGMIRVWKEAHPTIDVPAEILKAKAWLFSNQERKQYSRFGRFLGNWMSNAANPPDWMRAGIATAEHDEQKYQEQTQQEIDERRTRYSKEADEAVPMPEDLREAIGGLGEKLSVNP